MNEGTMNCPIKSKESTEILVDYCAQTLEPVRVAEFEKHLETCARLPAFRGGATRPLGDVGPVDAYICIA